MEQVRSKIQSDIAFIRLKMNLNVTACCLRIGPPQLFYESINATARKTIKQIWISKRFQYNEFEKSLKNSNTNTNNNKNDDVKYYRNNRKFPFTLITKEAVHLIQKMILLQCDF